MRLAVTAAIVLLLLAPAMAQTPAINLMGMGERKDPAQELRDKEIDQAYRAANSKLPDKKKKSDDPWGNVRSAEPAKK